MMPSLKSQILDAFAAVEKDNSDSPLERKIQMTADVANVSFYAVSVALQIDARKRRSNNEPR
jgi:hypothetical protein